MKVKKYEGATMRDAISKVKAELGEHAVILSTRDVRRGLLGSGVEIAAAIDDDHRDGPVRDQANNATVAPHREDDLETLRGELRSLRAIVRASHVGERQNAELRGELASLRRLVEELHNGSPPDAPTPAAVSRTRRTALVARSQARVVMLVGPTGAGKTTTIAKLAARAALVDHRRVAIVTLDNYRVGGIDQIRTFADLIGVPLHVGESAAALHALLAVTRDDDLVLVDTAGRSPRDAAAIDELARYARDADIETHLVAPAAIAPAQLDALVARYRALAPARLLFTKLDEVERAGELVAAPPRLALPITWVAIGQAVPEDLEEPTEHRLHELASQGLAALPTSAAA